jgi:hypothetical protein
MIHSDRVRHACQYCGFKSSNWMDQNKTGWFCRSELSCFNRLLRQNRDRQQVIRCMTKVGWQMANLCFSLSQQEGRTLGADVSKLMRELYDAWVLARGGRPA